MLADLCLTVMLLTFALSKVQLKDSLQQRVCIEGQVKLRANFRLQSSLHPLVLGRLHALDQSVRDLQTEMDEKTLTGKRQKATRRDISSSAMFAKVPDYTNDCAR